MGIVRWIRDRCEHRQRQIFQFWDGTRTRGIDPLVVLRLLAGHAEFNIERDPALCEVDDPAICLPAMELTARAVREAFKVGAYDEASGLTDGECFALIGAFGDYIAALKKNTSPPVTSPGSMAPPVSATSTMNAVSA